MSEDWNLPPPPPSDPITGSDAAGDVLNDFRKRIADLEAAKDLRSLSAEAEYKEMLKKEIQQRMEIRMIVILIAIAVLVFMGVVLTHASHTAAKAIATLPPSLLIVMFLGPVVSISTVTAMLLFGAFRQFKEEDLNKINVSSLAGEIAKTSSGN